MCNNPWPPLNDPATWPWKDSVANCSIKTCVGGVNTGKTCTGAAGCPGGSCDGCSTNNFEFYYCRDAGGPSTADDLPVINSTPAGLGKGTGFCESGYSYNRSCTDDGACARPASGTPKCINKVCAGGEATSTSGLLSDPGTPWLNPAGKCLKDEHCQAVGVCKVLLKEFIFGRDNSFSAQGTALVVNSNPLGKSAILSWPITVGATKYKVYYGLQSGKYTDNVDVNAATNCNAVSCNINIDQLKNAVYYFAFTSLNNSNTESAYSIETGALVKDTTPPSQPVNVRSSDETGSSATISWDANTDDIVSYVVYYKFAGALNYGFSKTVPKSVTSFDLTSLSGGKDYVVAVSAVDDGGNESVKTTIFMFTPPLTYNRQALKDLTMVNNALIDYKKAKGSYPLIGAGSSWEGYCSNWGTDKGENWIDGLVPTYISKLPKDSNTPVDYVCQPTPAAPVVESKQYIYTSNGVDYKLIRHNPGSLADVDPSFIDPYRCDLPGGTPCGVAAPYNAANSYWAFGYWSPGGIGF